MAHRLRSLLRLMRQHPRLTLLALFLLFALFEPRAALGLLAVVAMVLVAILVLAVMLTWAFGRPGLTWPKLFALVLGMRWAQRGRN